MRRAYDTPAMTDYGHADGAEYDVYLLEDAPEDLDVQSPLSTRHIEYYDSGVWIDHGDDRLFLPYARLFAIRERIATESADAAEESKDAGDDEPEPVDDPEDAVKADATDDEPPGSID